MKKKIQMLSALMGAIVLSFGAGAVANAEEADTINEGVYIGDVDVSGMTAEEAREAVEELVDELGSKTITLKAEDSSVSATASELGLSWENEEVVEEAVGLGKSGNIVKRYMDNKDLEHEPKVYDLDFSADESEIKSFVENNCGELNREAKDGSLTRENGYFEIVPGEKGVTINADQSAKAIQEYMDNEWTGESGSVELVAETVEPRGTEEELNKVQDVLGTATTYYGSTAARNQNVEVGAQKLNGHVLYPGDTFSVTQAVIPFTEENGYLPAPSYESGKVVDSYGGGICQVSTTLYNALLAAELEIVERHNHTMIVTYVDPSKDAAIAEGLMDLQFANNTDAPIYIEGYAYGGQLTFTIYGEETRSSDRVVEYVSETTSTTDPEGVQLNAKSDASVGYVAQTQSAHQGLTAVLWKVVTENGETTKTQVNSSTYQASPASYDVGIQSSDPNVVAAIQNAIAANDLNAVQSIIAGGVSSSTPETEAPQTEATESDTSQSESQQTESQESESQESETAQSETQPEAQSEETKQTEEKKNKGEEEIETPDQDVEVIE